MTQLVNVRVEDHIAIIELNHQPLNVLTKPFLGDIHSAVEVVTSNEEIRALVIQSASEKAFVAGADIKQFSELDPSSGQQLVERGKQIFDQIQDARFPVICAINGVALGGGLELALACDIRVAESKAKLGLPETGLGVLPGYGGTQRLARLIGLGKAKEMIFTGEPLKAEEAYRLGLVEHLVSDGKSPKVALEIAEKIAKQGPIAITNAKKAVNQGFELPLNEGQQIESELFAQLCETQDIQEGVEAFLEKRDPVFKGE
ncbi:enoyl-CoA hydratase/isomerase family protein [Alkalibacillus aidingensis]|uniref:enoyl-CoA hydratase/isomerase family protein n=1 Tax=Alkalibacillus aidingensis TaxID=2747607 RepID=UPI001CB74197|nr:enoyl-CoA hydratase-related protein [Alkalibacillus aidingensis]